jgi:hypothetical protein
VCVLCVCGVCVVCVCVVCVWCVCGVCACVCGVCVWCACVCVLCVCVCVVCVASVTQHAKRMRHIILSSVDCPTLTTFFYFITSTNFEKEQVIEHRTCVVIFSTNVV